MLDDLFLLTPVFPSLFQQSVDEFMALGGNYLKFRPEPTPVPIRGTTIGELPRGTLYRASTVISLWKTDLLLSLLKTGESAWSFELKGSERSDQYAGFFTTIYPVLGVDNMIVRGKWRPSALRRAHNAGIVIDTHTRPVMSLAEEFTYSLRLGRSAAVNHLPYQWRRTLRKWFLE